MQCNMVIMFILLGKESKVEKEKRQRNNTFKTEQERKTHRKKYRLRKKDNPRKNELEK